MLTFWGFGTASERLNKRVRDSTFAALLRQEVSYFDKRSVGRITSQLQDDATKIHAFSGEPVRSFLIAVASLVTGLVLSFVVCVMKYQVTLLPLTGMAHTTNDFFSPVYVAACACRHRICPVHGLCKCYSNEN